MNDIAGAFYQAMALIAGADPDLLAIVLLTLRVSLSAVALAALVALPLGGALALYRFPGRQALVVLINSLMGLPPVVVGLVVYLFLSRSGPLGGLGLLFTPTAMVIAQFVLITPIVAALARQVIEDLWSEYGEQLRSLGAGTGRAVATLLWDGRYSLLTSVLAGFGRAAAEVGAVLIVGGNIAHVTRVMTTAIALETSKGDLPLALGLGLILISLSIAVNGAAYLLRDAARLRNG
ncbi:MAG TPA: ABC transporter permease [bacterium]|jgi:tungstate transport system permease protein